jgi:hypothetical protein
MAENLRYPKRQLNSGNFQSDYIRFSIFEYKGSAVTIADTFATVTARKGAPKGTIALPIQSIISDQNLVDWQDDRLDFIKVAAADAGLEFMTTGGVRKSASYISAAIKKATGQTKDGQTPAGRLVSTALLENALGANLRSRFSGEVMNPNLELLFTGPTLRTFNFSFFMSARSPEEATEIKKIINAFKKNMAPKTTESLFLKSPNIFEIKYMNGEGKVHKSLNQIKICALQNCSVNYTPAGTYSTFGDTDNTMTAYSMTLQFGELDPIYDKDYDTHPIGY